MIIATFILVNSHPVASQIVVVGVEVGSFSSSDSGVSTLLDWRAMT